MYLARWGCIVLDHFYSMYVGQTAMSESDLCNQVACPDQEPRYTSNEKPLQRKKKTAGVFVIKL